MGGLRKLNTYPLKLRGEKGRKGKVTGGTFGGGSVKKRRTGRRDRAEPIESGTPASGKKPSRAKRKKKKSLGNEGPVHLPRGPSTTFRRPTSPDGRDVKKYAVEKRCGMVGKPII